MKQKTVHRLHADTDEYGDVYTYVALDADTKLVPSFHVGKRDRTNTHLFVRDVKARITNRPQVTTDAYQAYFGAMVRSFGQDVDYAHEQKVFASELNSGRGRYSPPVLTACDKQAVIGDPDPAFISTSFVERQNLTMRMSMRRFTRLTNGFSKKRENLVAAVCLHFAHYNFCRTHKTLKTTPAVRHGIADHVWRLRSCCWPLQTCNRREFQIRTLPSNAPCRIAATAVATLASPATRITGRSGLRTRISRTSSTPPRGSSWTAQIKASAPWLWLIANAASIDETVSQA